MEEIQDGNEGMRLIDMEVAVVLLVVVDPRAFAALGPQEVGNREDLLVLLEYAFRVWVIFSKKRREVMLRFEIGPLEYVPDIMIAPHNSFSVSLQALSNQNMMFLHCPYVIHRHVIEILRKQLEVKPLRIGPLIIPLRHLHLILGDKGTLNLSNKLMLKDIQQMQLLQCLANIPLHNFPISRKERNEDVSI